jgi:hypothetical protein
MLFKPAGSVTPPPSIGEYNGEPLGGGMGMGMGRPGTGGGQGRGMTGGGGGANAEFTARRVEGDRSKGAAGKWVAKDGDNEMILDLKASGSKLTGTFENTQMPGAIEIKDGKIEGNKISFDYVRQMNGQDFQVKWTGTLSGDEIQLKRELGGGPGGGGMPGFGRGAPPAGN